MRTTRLPLLASSLLLAATAACGTATNYMQTGTAPRPTASRSDESVDLYADRTPARPFVEIGMIEGHRRSKFSWAQTFDIYGAIRHEGAENGCDAVVITGDHTLLDGRHTTLEGYIGSCVMYLAIPAAPSVATAAPSVAPAPASPAPAN